jgi:predicted dienelactone hydrolase
VWALLPSTAGARCPAGSATGAFVEPGAFGVGEHTLDLVDGSRPTPAHGDIPEKPDRTLATEVWYPTERGETGTVRDARLARGGPFPLVVNSPGLLDVREGEAYYAEALASRGYVVASLDFPVTGLRATMQSLGDLANQPRDVSFVIDSLLALSKLRDGWLSRGVDRHRIGVAGLSLGGATTLLVTYHPTLRDHRVRAALPIAPAACFFSAGFYRAARPPLLVLQGDQDLLVPLETNGERVFERSRSPRSLVTLIHGTHTAFSGFVTAPSTTSYDAVGCAAISGVVSSGDVLAGLGGPDIIDATGCALPCQSPPPGNIPMQADRQHRLTKAVVTAFFDLTLKRSHAARCFLRHGLSTGLTTENSDVLVAAHGPGR